MTAEQVLSFVNKKGIILTAYGDQIIYKSPTGVMTPDIVEIIRKHKPGILGILNPDQGCESIPSYARVNDNQNILPGNCNSCPAAGYWDFMGPGKWCFHRAYFLGKAGHPSTCDTAKHDCPLKMAK